MTQDTSLSLNVINKLRELSKGNTPISANSLADAILKERLSNPPKTLVTLMRARVLVCMHQYFPGLKPDTPVTLGQGKPQENVQLKVSIIDRDALISEMIYWLKSNALLDTLPTELLRKIAIYRSEYLKEKAQS